MNDKYSKSNETQIKGKGEIMNPVECILRVRDENISIDMLCMAGRVIQLSTTVTSHGNGQFHVAQHTDMFVLANTTGILAAESAAIKCDLPEGRVAEVVVAFSEWQKGRNA